MQALSSIQPQHEIEIFLLLRTQRTSTEHFDGVFRKLQSNPALDLGIEKFMGIIPAAVT